METRLKAFVNIKAFREGKSLDFIFASENQNPDYNPIFIKDYAMGVMEGMRCKYAAPVVAVYEVDENGMEKCVDYWGDQNYRTQLKSINRQYDY